VDFDSPTDLLKHAQDLRASWQGRALAHAQGRMMVVISSVLAHTYDEAMAVMFRVVQPKCWDVFRQTLRTPFLCSAAKINKNGQIVADVILYDGAVKQTKVIFASELDFQTEFRKLADALKLSDHERREMFAVAKRWVVADTRLDPMMDPRDPDAKRCLN